MFELNKALLAELESLDTPTVCNALEIVDAKRRGWGYTTRSLVCVRPDLKPMVGVARTATIRSAHPGDLAGEEARRLSDDYYAYIDGGAKPSIVVIQDIDESPGYGSLWGEVNSAIHLGLGCVGVVTDGGVRDLPAIAKGFQMLAGSVIPSHAFVHVVDFARPVNVAGMRVRDGDLIHADQHGAVVIPHAAAASLKATAEQIAKREKVIIEAAGRPGFNIDQLRAAIGKAAEIH
jgi:regulator of RNase E activity RraA